MSSNEFTYSDARLAGMEIWMQLMDQPQFQGAPSLNSWMKEFPEDEDDYDTTTISELDEREVCHTSAHTSAQRDTHSRETVRKPA
jgi:hypothetical protein